MPHKRIAGAYKTRTSPGKGVTLREAAADAETVRNALPLRATFNGIAGAVKSRSTPCSGKGVRVWRAPCPESPAPYILHIIIL